MRRRRDSKVAPGDTPVNTLVVPAVDSAVQPTFVLCFSRTGSTLLRYVLDTHPLLGCPPEFHVGRVGKTLKRTYKIILDEERFEDEQALEDFAIERVREHFDAMFNRYLHNRGKQAWCEKSVFSIDHLGLIRRLFPEARFVCLYRNCLDMVASGLEVLRRFDPSGQRYGFNTYLEQTRPLAEAGLADYWIDKTQRVLDAERELGGRAYRIEYEDLTAKSQATVPGLFEFLGVEYDPTLLDNVFQEKHVQGPGDPKIRQAQEIHVRSVGRGHAVSRVKIGADRVRRINELHAQLGYPELTMSGGSRLASKALHSLQRLRVR